MIRFCSIFSIVFDALVSSGSDITISKAITLAPAYRPLQKAHDFPRAEDDAQEQQPEQYKGREQNILRNIQQRSGQADQYTAQRDDAQRCHGLADWKAREDEYMMQMFPVWLKRRPISQ